MFHCERIPEGEEGSALWGTAKFKERQCRSPERVRGIPRRLVGLEQDRRAERRRRRIPKGNHKGKDAAQAGDAKDSGLTLSVLGK